MQAVPSIPGRPKARGLPLSLPPEQRDLFSRLLDPDHMLAVFRRELPPMAERAIRVATCSIKPGRSEKPLRKGKLELVYRIGIEVGDEPAREYVLLGVSPVGAEFPARDVMERARVLRDHPAVSPFTQLAVHVRDLQLGLMLYPLDPALPGLAAITGSDGARLLASFLPECRRGAEVERIECELMHYKPFNRAVLRVRALLSRRDGASASASRRTVYVKVFYNDRGAVNHEELASLWSVAQRSKFLRVPEPLGYDPDQRLLVMSEAEGERHLNEWIRCIKKGQPLPAGASSERLERCVVSAARALGELQGSGLHPERYEYENELAHLRRDRGRLDQDVEERYPELIGSLDALVRRLEALAPVEEPLVPSHGEFRHQQLVGDEDSLTLIDWDSFCLANPAMDAARWLARLTCDSLGDHAGTPGLEWLAATFRREFLSLRPDAAAHLALYEGLHVTKHLVRAFAHASRGDNRLQHIRLLALTAGSLLERVEASRAGRVSRR
jgi:hypothetical protein